jgi:ubiquinol-cytochrome c reductase iron-sulfur subunit
MLLYKISLRSLFFIIYMSEDAKDNEENSTRRDFIVLTASSMVGIGAVCACFPLLDSMNPSADVIALSSIEIDISGIQRGETKTFSWRGKPIFVRNRTDEEIQIARSVQLSSMIDPESDSDRVKTGHEQWLVLIGVCTHLGCVPNGDDKGWLCPCHGSHYDISGRVTRGPAPSNLVVPTYTFISDTKIKIG